MQVIYDARIMPSEFIPQRVFIFYNILMKSHTKQNFINRLMSCGYPCHDAVRTVCAFLKDYGEEELQQFVLSIERDRFHVDTI